MAHILNFNAGTILLGFMLYKLGVDIQFKISVFFGADNSYNAKVDACNRTAWALTENGLSFVAARNLHQ